MNHLTLAIIDILFLLAGIAIGIFLTKKAGVWLESVRMLNLIGVLRKDLDEKAAALKSSREQVTQLKKRNVLLEQEVQDLKEQLAHRESTINTLLKKVDARDELIEERDKQIKVLLEKMEHFEKGKQDFERRLLEYLAKNFGTGPEEVASALGIDIYESPSDQQP